MQQLSATFETVPTQAPPAMGQETALCVIDGQDTFTDVTENGGKYPVELPVAGAEARIPSMMTAVAIANSAQALIVGTFDTHVRGKNPTIVSSFNGILRETWVTPQMVDSWTDEDHPILPTAGFTLGQYREWIHMVGGAMIWGDHGNPDSPLYRINPRLFRLMVQNPNFQQLRKGQHPSTIIPGFCPESYSAAEMSTGESLGLYEMLVARGITRVKIVGIAGDFCGGTTGVHLAEKGLEVWMCTDAQASVVVPDYAGTGQTSESLMIQRLTDAGAHFYKTADDVAVNGHLLSS